MITLDGTVQSFDISQLFDKPVREGGERSLLSPGGHLLAIGAYRDVGLWDTRTGQRIGAPVSGPGNILAFSPDGRRLAAAASWDDRVWIIDTGSGGVLDSFRASAKEATGIGGLAFSPDGHTLAISSSRQYGLLPLELRDLRTGSLIRTDLRTGDGFAFRPDGKMLVAGASPQIVDPATGARRPPPGGLGSLTAPYAFRPDGGVIAVNASSRISLWKSDLSSSVGDLAEAAQPLSLSWSPDGDTLASYERDGGIRIWDVPHRQHLGLVFEDLSSLGSGEAASVAFSADGKTLYGATPGGVLRRFPLDGERAAAAVCARAGRGLTTGEWQRYLPGTQPFTVCG